MAREWVSASQDSVVFGAPIKDSTEAALISKGYFLGIDSNGKAVLANAWASEGTVVEAKGAAWDDGTIGDAIKTVALSRIGFCRTNKLTGFSGLTLGAKAYLSSGGGITQTAPVGAGQLLQEVGFALTADTIFIDVHPAELLT